MATTKNMTQYVFLQNVEGKLLMSCFVDARVADQKEIMGFHLDSWVFQTPLTVERHSRLDSLFFRALESVVSMEAAAAAAAD